ncbi:superoxide dismutase family protein [Streptomyces albicerus]|uniref:superoxide dismutase family protein n=1 Tax=Streptomyces albicerus TaxID=2569859 RepID=UPI00124B255B|nr:superoxide dismutase family protein [Streptomyces albicerus]
MLVRHVAGAASAAAVLAVPFLAGTAAACPEPVKVHAEFAPPEALPEHDAVTYDEAGVPVGSRVTVIERVSGEGGTEVELRLKGVDPDRTYGAHVHRKPCGPLPADSGPHYQDRVDPVQPSTDPEYANPDNEIWLDLTTDTHGRGGSEAAVEWTFRTGEARSVVIHEHATHTEPGHAGEAGARLACVDVPFV